MGRMGFLIAFDLRDSEAMRRCYDELGAWREQADIGILDLGHAVFIIRPGVSPHDRRAA